MEREEGAWEKFPLLDPEVPHPLHNIGDENEEVGRDEEADLEGMEAGLCMQ